MVLCARHLGLAVDVKTRDEAAAHGPMEIRTQEHHSELGVHALPLLPCQDLPGGGVMSLNSGDAPDGLWVPDVETFVERYAPELRPAPVADGASVAFATTMVAIIAGSLTAGGIGAVSGVVAALLVAALGVYAHLRIQSRGAHEFEETLRERPWEIYAVIARRFRRGVEAQRARLLGPQSEWGRARAPLEEAVEEARRSLAYWKERVAQDPGQPSAREHEATAERLVEKFERALAELDGRSRTLRDFFHTCEAKLAALESSKRDAEESRRLAHLSEGADDLTHDARRAMDGMARDVLRQVLEVAQVLGAAERLAIQHTAGDVPIDRIEAVADRILASADEERRALDGMVAQFGSGPSAEPDAP